MHLSANMFSLHDAYLSRRRSPAARAALKTAWKSTLTGWIPRTSTIRRWTSCCPTATASFVPGGFGHRGIEGMIMRRTTTAASATFRIWAFVSACRSRSLPLPATCWATRMQTPVNLLRRASHRVIDLMPRASTAVSTKGGTMRLGAYPCRIRPNTQMAEAYEQRADFRAPSSPLRI